MATRPTYRNLQLDPDDQSRMAAFSALCWQHILEHVSPRWVAEVREGTIRLLYRTVLKSSGQTFSVFNKQLNEVVAAFVEKYAMFIWPRDDEDRTHLATAGHVRDMREIHARWCNMTITTKKEGEMRECNIATTGANSIAESMIGCRVRAFLTQLLVSDEPVPARQHMSAMTLLQRFLMAASTPKCSSGGRNDTPSDFEKFDSRRPSDHGRSESPRARKRRRVDDTATPPTSNPCERNAGYIRLRFTYSGFHRLQCMLFCPSRPPVITRKNPSAVEGPVRSQSVCIKNENLEPQQVEEYQCWLRNCGEIFQTAGQVLDHVKGQHPASIKAATPAMAQVLAGLLSNM